MAMMVGAAGADRGFAVGSGGVGGGERAAGVRWAWRRGPGPDDWILMCKTEILDCEQVNLLVPVWELCNEKEMELTSRLWFQTGVCLPSGALISFG